MHLPRDSWVWLLVLFTVASLVESAFFGQMVAFTPLYLPLLGVPAEEVSVWTGRASAFMVIGLPLLPFWGALADRYSRQPIIVRTFIVHLLAGVLAMLAPSLWVFILARGVMSFSLGNSGLMMTTLSEKVPTHRIGLALAIMNTAAPLGSFLGPLAGGTVVDQWGFPALLVIMSVLMLVVVVGLSFGYRDDFRGRETGPLLRMAGDSLRIIWQNRQVRTLFPALFLLFAGWMMAWTYVPVAITELYTGPDPGTVVGAVFGAGGAVAMLVGPGMGWLADRYGHWRVLLVGAAIEAVLWPVGALTGSLVAFAAAWAVINGVASGVFAISFSVLAAAAPSDVRGRVMAFAYLPVNIAFFLGPVIGSLVVSASVFAVFPAAALITAGSLPLLLMARRLSSVPVREVA